MSDERERHIFMTKLAEQAERFDGTTAFAIYKYNLSLRANM
jgi:hypothetical protein